MAAGPSHIANLQWSKAGPHLQVRLGGGEGFSAKAVGRAFHAEVGTQSGKTAAHVLTAALAGRLHSCPPDW
jgi:hypothetical protein